MRGCPRMNFLFNSIWRQHFYFNGKQLIESTCHLKNLLWVTYAIDHTFYGFYRCDNPRDWRYTRKSCKSRAKGEWFTSFSSVLPTSRVGYHTGKTHGKCGLLLYKITLSFLWVYPHNKPQVFIQSKRVYYLRYFINFIILPAWKNILMWLDSWACAHSCDRGRDWNSSFFPAPLILVPSTQSPPAFWRCPADQKARRLGTRLAYLRHFSVKQTGRCLITLPKLIAGLQSKTCVKFKLVKS